MGIHFWFRLLTDKIFALETNETTKMREIGFSTVALLLALVSPAPTTAFFFGVQLTNPAGGVIGATNPTQTGILAGLGLAGATLGALGVANALNNRPATTTVVRRPRYKYRGRYRNYRRGKRQAPAAQQNLDASAEVDVGEIVESTLNVIATNDLEGCFQRLFCDISAKPSGFERDLPIVSGVAQRLMEAFDMGSNLRSVDSCETKYQQCQWTGEQMDAEIERMAKAAQQQQQQQ